MTKTTLCKIPWIFVLLATASACQHSSRVDSPPLPQLSDRQATPHTVALYANLAAVGRDHLLFGHQDSLAYGVKWQGQDKRSDIKDVTGSFPAIVGWDVGHLGDGDAQNLDGVPFEFMASSIRTTFLRGGVSTISWHMRNPATGGNSWDTQATVKHLLPGGRYHQKYRRYLDAFAEFNETLRVDDENGKPVHIPVIFRPLHEHNGDWFWWGKAHTDEQDYVALWRYTVDYLRGEKNAHNLIWAFSPDRSRLDLSTPQKSYLYGYPGDAYVDIIGLDNYWDLGHPSNAVSESQSLENFIASLHLIVQLAQEKGKIAALTEGGQENLPDLDLWTHFLLKGFLHDSTTRQVAYFLVWRNANEQKEQRQHFFAPFDGHASADDFRDFYNDPLTVFQDQLPDMYRQ